MDDELLDLQVDKNINSIIKVVGVGGGGGNAVNHMYNLGIHDVSFALCNTDNQVLRDSPVPEKLQLGKNITGGLGAGNRPDKAKAAAEESLEDIKRMFDDGTRMTFITAGMGGGTGTGAAPVVAKVAKDMGILTVGIVTIPFLFEGDRKIIQALKGVEEMSHRVDALLVINNQRLCDIYGTMTLMEAFAKADDTLANAAKSIAEIITMHGYVNLDFADVYTTLKDGGVAIMSSGIGEGESRVKDAINNALHSPLLDNKDVFNAKKILINLSFSEKKPMVVEELNALHEFMGQFGREIEVIWGAAIDDSLAEKVKITILATGFSIEDVTGIDRLNEERKAESDEERQRREAEKAKEKELIRKYYGEIAKYQSVGSYPRKPYILAPDEFDNDTLLDILEKTPVFKRESNFDPHDYRNVVSKQSDTLF